MRNQNLRRSCPHRWTYRGRQTAAELAYCKDFGHLERNSDREVTAQALAVQKDMPAIRPGMPFGDMQQKSHAGKQPRKQQRKFGPVRDACPPEGLEIVRQNDSKTFARKGLFPEIILEWFGRPMHRKSSRGSMQHQNEWGAHPSLRDVIFYCDRMAVDEE